MLAKQEKRGIISKDREAKRKHIPDRISGGDHKLIPRVLICLTLSAVIIPLSVLGATVVISVPGTADIYLAGQSAGSTAGSDVAPLNSPILGSLGLTLIAGNSLTFSATGITGGAGCTSTNPEGCANFSTGPFNGISTYLGPAQALTGVFVTNSIPSGVAPPGLDFSGSNSFSSLSPGLNVVFFIGDGLTGKGTGSTQGFVIPTGATRLFLGSSDSVGTNFNNSGAYNVTVNDNLTVPGVPEPATFVLVLPILLVAMILKRLRSTLVEL